MRTRTGWLLCLVTAGLVLAPRMGWAQSPEVSGYTPDPRLAAVLTPYTARAQLSSPTNDYDVPRADPAYPLPLYHDRPDTGGFYTAAEFLFWRQTNPLHHQLITVRGLLDTDGSIHQDITPGQAFNSLGTVVVNQGSFAVFPSGFTSAVVGQTGNPPAAILGNPAGQIVGLGNALPGGFIGSGRGALWADDAGGPSSYTPGFCVTMGYRFREGFAAEVSWTHLANVRYTGGATLIPQGSQLGAILEESFLYSPVYNFPTAYAGPAQKLALGNPQAAFGIWNGATEETVRFDQHLDQWDIGARIPMIETDCCRCYGLAGVRNLWLWENFKWRTVSYNFQGLADATDAAIYNNIVSNEMYGGFVGCGSECYLGHGFSVSLDMRAAALIDFVHEEIKWQRGDFATEAKRSRREYTIVPELDATLSLWWYPIEGVEIRLGYDVKNLFNTISSPNPVSFNFNGLDPGWQHEAYRLIDGWRAGISFTF